MCKRGRHPPRFFFQFLEVGLPYFILPDSRYLLGFLPSLCGREISRGIPSRTLENLLAIIVPTHTSLEFEGNNLLPFQLFLNVSHFNRLSTAQRAKIADSVDFFVDPAEQKNKKS